MCILTFTKSKSRQDFCCKMQIFAISFNLHLISWASKIIKLKLNNDAFENNLALNESVTYVIYIKFTTGLDHVHQ